ncbi:MAG: radical SAM protein [Lentimicrobium sp.]|nr:radical SAM protein [Lentimicrobium sp.]
MSGFLFDDIVFGPVKSRRFGVSLGINLLPENRKICSFNCIYCECGLSDYKKNSDARLHSFTEIADALLEKFNFLSNEGLKPDNITFAGNGEPTLHPDFLKIIDHIIALRDKYFPLAKITVLSNSTRLHIPEVKEALLRIDNNVLKLDAGSQEMFERINRPASNLLLENIVEQLVDFNGKLKIQTLFLKGLVNGHPVDNTTDEELSLWLDHIRRIQPESVMLYPIERETPETGIEKISNEKLKHIATLLAPLNIKAEIFG